MDCKIFFLVLFAFVGANAFHSLIPADKELVYHYHARVESGTEHPVAYASSMVLDGMVHMQRGADQTVLVKFADMKYKTHVGEKDIWHEFQADMKPISAEMKDYENIFKISYDAEGHGTALWTESHEKLLVVNMKKALASMLQMDVEQVHLDSVKPHAFVDFESSLWHPDTKMMYNIEPMEHHLQVTKMMEYNSTRHMYKWYTTNMEYDYCRALTEQPMSHDDYKVYKIVNKDSHHVIDNIEAIGGIFYQPFNGESIKYMVDVNQTMELKEMKPLETKFAMKSERKFNNFKFFIVDLEAQDDVFINFDRSEEKMEKIMTQVMDLMPKAMEYLHTDHMNEKKPDYLQGGMITYMIKMMFRWDLAMFEKFHDMLMQKTGEMEKHYLELYHHLLPMIGTRHSMMHIKKIIHDVKVKEYMAVEMLQEMPLHVKFPTLKVIKEMEEMIHWGTEISWEVRKAAVLSFATLLHKAVHFHDQFTDEYNTMWHGDEHYTQEMMPEIQVIEKYMGSQKVYEHYLVEFVNRMKTAKDSETKALYISAMHNTKMEAVLKHLTPLVKGEWWNDYYLRMMGSFAVFPVIAGHEDRIYELYWPIMTDESLPTTLRAVAVFLIMESQPKLARLHNMVDYMMEHAESHTLYQFFYSYMKQISMTKDPCKQHFAGEVKQMLKHLWMPEHMSMTGYYEMEWVKSPFTADLFMKWFYVHAHNETEKFFVFSADKGMFNHHVSPYTISLRIDGMEGCLIQDFKLDLTNPNKLFNYDELVRFVSSIPTNKDIKITLNILKYNQVIMINEYDHTNMNKIVGIFDFIWGQKFSMNKKFVHAKLLFSQYMIMPSAIGMPVVYEMMTPEVDYYDFEMTKETANKMTTYKFDNHMKMWKYELVGLSFYNPFADSWHAIHRVGAHDSVIPMLMDVTFNPTQQSMKITWKRHEDPVKDIMGVKSHFSTLVTYWNYDEVSTKLMSYGDQYRHDYTLYEKEHPNIGYDTTWMALDAENYYHPEFMKQMYDRIHKSLEMHTSNPIAYWYKFLVRLNKVFYVQPTPMSSGLMFRMVPSKEYPTTSIDMTVRFNQEYKKTPEHMRAGMKLNTRATYAVKNQEKATRTWDLNVLFDTMPGHTQSNMKAQLTRLIPGQKDYKMCLDGTTKWTMETVTAHWSLAMSQSADGKCTKDETFIDVTMADEETNEQKADKHMYGSCMKRVWSDVHHMRSMSCLMDQTSLRKRMFNIKMSNVPTEFKKFATQWFNHLKADHISTYNYVDEPKEKMEQHNMKIKLIFPMIGHMDLMNMKHFVSMYIYTPEHEHQFIEIAVPDWMYHYMGPSNTKFSTMYKFLYQHGLLDRCFVDEEYIHNAIDQSVGYVMPSEWTLYLGDAEKTPKSGIWTKNIEGSDKIAVKFTHKTSTLEIIPNGDKYDYIMDGKKITDMDYTSDWFYYKWLQEPELTMVLFYRMGVTVVYDGHHLDIKYPKSDMALYGHCMDTQHHQH